MAGPKRRQSQTRTELSPDEEKSHLRSGARTSERTEDVCPTSFVTGSKDESDQTWNDTRSYQRI